MNTSIRKFLSEEDGVTALEYGLLAAIVAGVIVLAFKGPLTTLFGDIFTKLSTVVSESSSPPASS